MFTSNSIVQEVRQFIVSNFLYGQDRSFKDDDSLMGEGIVDSTGVLQLVAFLEETCGIIIEDEELIPENLDSITSISAYCARKMSAPAETNVYEQQAGNPGGSLCSTTSLDIVQIDAGSESE